MDFLVPFMVNRARESNLDIDGTQSSEETHNNTDIEDVECPGTEVDDTDIESQNALGNELNDSHGSEREEGSVVDNAETELTVSEPTK
ncbi:hypothetical protein JTB14_025538 [Gonioctena quinquepunctata]|nr:hypothetical protein JTB14_025538 [Gonioctena quinquepunctata]